MSKEKYMEDRNKAMMMYPDTSGLDDLVKNYPEYFDERFRRSWEFIGRTNPSAKLRTLEKMILSVDIPELDGIRKRIKSSDDEKTESGLIED